MDSSPNLTPEPRVSADRSQPAKSNWADLLDWRIEQRDDTPLYESVCALLRDQILAGVIPPGSRLPSTRQLMGRLGVSRTTVVTAYAQLTADGFVTCKVGSGTFVADSVLDGVADVGGLMGGDPSTMRPQHHDLSDRGQRYTDIDLDSLSLPNVAFNTGVVRIDGRSAAQWQNAVRQSLAVESMQQGYAPPQGGEALRQEVARYVCASRGVRCTADQIMLVAGSQQAIDLTIKVLLDPGAPVWVEDPGYPLTRYALQAAGMKVHAVPVDEDGMQVSRGVEVCADARAVFVTPSHQYPLGVSLSIERRAQLLDWAERRRAWIVEDDYDSEFRYNGPSLPALQGLDRHDRVVYIGSFSKVLQPGIRYGYMVVPMQLIKAFKIARLLADRHSPVFLEHVLTNFMGRGHFVSHIRRMRGEYGLARDVLVEMLSRRLGHALEVVKPNQGLHLIGYLKQGLSDQAVAREALKVGVVVRPISRLYVDPQRRRSGLMFGFAGFSEARMKTAVERLAVVLDEMTCGNKPLN
ncbi:PLP-dependent aminotransferase family protein [soil metagenome]